MNDKLLNHIFKTAQYLGDDPISEKELFKKFGKLIFREFVSILNHDEPFAGYYEICSEFLGDIIGLIDNNLKLDIVIPAKLSLDEMQCFSCRTLHQMTFPYSHSDAITTFEKMRAGIEHDRTISAKPITALVPYYFLYPQYKAQSSKMEVSIVYSYHTNHFKLLKADSLATP